MLERDTAVINIPLSKRGNLDAEIDRYKARKAKEDRDAYKAQQAQHYIDQGKAKEAVLNLADERAAELCKSLGLTRKQLDAKLYRIAHWTPKQILSGI
jgi:hypothetical protein